MQDTLELPLQIVHVEQGSEEWHAVRRQFRPASMSPWITKASRYAGPKDALAFFKNEPKEVDPWLQKMWNHGKALEPVAATALEEILAIGGEPIVGTRGKYLASLDFYNERECFGAEVKCPYQGLRSKTWKFAEKGIIDPAYLDQIETQCRVFGLRRAGLYVYVNRQHNIFVPFEPSLERWSRIEETWDRFFDGMAAGVDPDAPALITETGPIALAETYRELQERIKALETNAAEIKKQIEAAAGGKPAKFGDVLTVRYETRSGSIDYASLVQEHCPSVDVEAYRGDPTAYSKIVLSKPKAAEAAAPAEPKQPRARKPKQ